MVTRRRFLAQTAPLTLAPLLARCTSRPSPSTAGEVPSQPLPDGMRFAFLHGVASGDPLRDAVMIWTRVTPEALETAALPDAVGARADAGDGTQLAVDYRVALDPALTNVVQEGRAATSASADYTLKVDVTGLAPATTYYYQFRLGDAASPIGRTRTLPEGSVDRLRFAITSCANYPQGYFHAYRKIAERAELDLVLYLGDYIYEYANGTYGDGGPLGRVPAPDREIVTLDDYRQRHAQYKLDPDLQEVHRQHPAVVIWDDHEFTDNAHRSGAGNHQASAEGTWEARRDAAIRAYYEWMPLRAVDPADPTRIYRSFAFGDLVDLLLLDTRIVGRDRQISDECDPAQRDDPARTLLGSAQENWLTGELAASKQRGTRWRLVAQQVAFAEFVGDPPIPGCVGSDDKWSAYASTRTRVLDALEGGAIDNVVILTGDSHSSWGLDVPRAPFDPSAYDPVSGRGSLAVELITPGVTSPAIPDAAQAAASERRYKATHPHVRFAEHHSQGYILLDVTPESARAEWFFVSPVREPGASERPGGAVATASGQNHLVPA